MGTGSLHLQGRVSRLWVCLLLLLGFSVLFAGPERVSAAPAVTAASPAAGATEVPTDTVITATLNEPLDPETMTTGSVTLSQPVRIRAIAGGYKHTLVLKDNGTVAGWGYNGYGQTSAPAGLNSVTAIATENNHNVVLKSDGTVVAWGENGWGQSTVPAGLTGVTAIAAGGDFTLALKADKTVVAWGDNSHGQTAIPGGLAGVTAIATGSFHALALKTDGTVAAWGYNSSGQTTVPAGLTGVRVVAAGVNHSVALKTDGTVVAWGANDKGQSAVPAGLSGVVAIAAGLDHTLALKNDGSVVAWGDNSYGQSSIPAGLTGIVAVATGYYHSIALKGDGSVILWGDNSYSQTTLPAGVAGVTGVAAGYNHTVALKSDGTLSAWGNNDAGQAVIPAGLSGVSAVAAGISHTLSLSSSGVVTAWGRNYSGQATVPTDLGIVAEIAAGDDHSVALKSDGTVVAWGQNTNGQTTVPAGLSGVTKIAAGSAHTVALKQDGTVTAWGSNYFNASSTPVGLSGVIAIAAGGYHSVVLKNDGTVTAWGENTQGQSTVPSGLTGVIAIAAGKSHSVALKSDGTVVAWGANDLGQSSVPAGLSGVVAIAAGYGHTVAVKNDGTLVGWGHNIIGQAAAPQDPYLHPVAIAVSYSTASNSVTLDPIVALPPATTLTATVNTGVRSLDGTHPAADYSWSFTTVTSPVTTASPGGGTYSAAQDVTLTANEPATIYYTTNGNDPTISSPVYSGPIRIMVDTILKFFARDPAGNNEAVKTENYSFAVDTTPPVTTVSPGGGTYSAAQNVTLTANEPAAIYYTTNGNDPTVSSPVYSSPIQILVSTILKFFARDTAGNNEAVKTATYTLNIDTTPPVTTASPGGGTYSAAQSVTLTASEPATIYYTTNGNDPTIASPVYSSPIQILVSTILKFFARDAAGNNEAVKSVTYTLNLDTTPPVTSASPGGGTYSSAQNVTLTASEPATIYYTTNGNDPTISSPVYSGPIQILVSTILKFFGRDSAGNNETVRAETYNIKQNQTIAFAPLPVKTYGDPAFALGATASSGLPVTYTSSNTSVATVSGTTVTIVGAGTTTITASQNGDATYNPATAVARTLTVNKTLLTVRAADASRVYGAANPAFSAIYSGFINGDTQAVLSGSPGLSTAATPTSPAGAYPIIAAAGTLAAANYSFSFVNGTLTVTRAGQAITFGALPVKTYGDPAFTLTATASSGLPVSYTSSNPAVATVSGDTLTIVGAGTATITANQGGDATYNPAAAVTQTLGVNNATLTVQAANATRVYGADNPVFTATYTGFVNGDTQAVLSGSPGLSAAAIASSPAGSYPITAAVGTLASASYSFSFVNGTLTVTKAGQTITFDALPAKTYGDPAFTLSATAGSGLPASYMSSNSAVATVSGSTVTIVGVGTATITASQGGDGNYNAAPDVAQPLTVNKAAAVVTLGSLNTTYDGTPKEATATTVPAGLNVGLTYNDAATAPTAVASYAVVGSVSDPNYQGSASGTMTIAKGNQTITFSALPARTYGDPSFTLDATSTSGLAVSYTSSNPAVATISGTTVTIVGAGTATITASQGGDGNYNAAPDVVQPLTINKATATVTLGSLSTTYDGTPKAATATTVPAGLNVIFTYNGAATAPTAVASYTVVGSVSDPNYQGNASGILTIAKGNQTITFGALPVKTYGNAAFALAATANSGLAVSYTSSNPAVATISGSTVTIVGAGTATITATQSGDANYNAAPAVAQTLTVNKAPATITFGLLTFTYDGNPKPVTVTTIPAGLAVAITYDGSATAPTDVGNYTVVATVNDANYQGTATATEEIAKKSQTITFGPLPVKTYGDAPFLFSADASSNLNLTFEYDTTIATITKQGQKYLLTIVGAGTTIVTATQPGNRNYSEAPPVSQTLTVNKAAGTVTLGNLSATYDGSAKAATATTTPAGRAVSFTYNGSATPPIAAGSYSVIGTINDANYQGSASGTLTIARASQTVTFGMLPAKSYGNAPFSPNATASSGLAISYTSSNPAVATISGTTVTIVGVGTTTITASQGGDSNYNTATAVPQTLTVGKGAATVTLGSLNATYNGTARAATATTVPNGLQVTLTYNGSATEPVAVGTYTVTATVIDGLYEGNTTGTLTIDKGAQTITFGTLPLKTAVDAPFTLDATSTSGLAVSYTSSNPAVATISGTTVTIVGAGITTITAGQEGDGNYSAAAAVPQTLTVNKGTATVSLGNLSPTYNGTALAATATTVPSGLPVVFTYNGSATVPVAVGSYTVVATVTDANYEGSATGTLAVAKGAQEITFASLPARTYGEPAFNLTAVASSGLAVTYTSSNPAVATLSGSTVTIVGAGTTTITASQGGDGNYNAAAPVPQTVIVGKGTATVTLGGLSTTYNGTPRAATATTVPNGLPVTLTYNGAATVPTAAGTYPVLATVTSPNYQGSATATLTIARGAQSITFGALPVKTVGNAPFTLTAMSTSGLAVSYSSSNPAVATISGTTVTIVGAGTATITANQGGDGNYDAASPVSQALTVNAAQAATGKTAVTIGTTTSYYDTVTAALAAIPAGSTTTIRLQTMTFAEAVSLNISGSTVSISGGYDSGFTSATGMTTIQGSLTIGAGALIADKLVIM